VKRRDAFDHSRIESVVREEEFEKDAEDPGETCPDDPVKNIRTRNREGRVLARTLPEKWLIVLRAVTGTTGPEKVRRSPDPSLIFDLRRFVSDHR